MSKVKILKVILDVRGKKIELNLNEARELRNILNDTFPIYILYRSGTPYQPYDIWWSYTKTIADDTLCLSVSK